MRTFSNPEELEKDRIKDEKMQKWRDQHGDDIDADNSDKDKSADSASESNEDSDSEESVSETMKLYYKVFLTQLTTLNLLGFQTKRDFGFDRSRKSESSEKKDNQGRRVKQN